MIVSEIELIQITKADPGPTIKTELIPNKLADAIYTYLTFKFSTQKINNFNIINKVLLLYKNVIKIVTNKFSRFIINELLKLYFNNISDKQLGEHTTDLLIEMFYQTNNSVNINQNFLLKKINFLLINNHNPTSTSSANVTGIKLPLTHETYLKLLLLLIKNYQLNLLQININIIINLCLIELENKNSAVRLSSIDVLIELYHFFGPKINNLIFGSNLGLEMKNTIKSNLETEFQKIGYDSTLLSNFTQKNSASGASNEAVSGDISGTLCCLLNE